MRFAAFILLTLSISIGLYFFGFTSAMGYTACQMANEKTFGINSSINNTDQGTWNSCALNGMTPQRMGEATASNPQAFLFEPATILRAAGQIVTGANNSGFLLIFGAAVAATLIAAFMGGFSANFVAPIFLLFIILEFYIFPFSFLFNQTLPAPFGFLIVIILNTLTLLSIIGFIRGGI
jgi:hypothetical protein